MAQQRIQVQDIQSAPSLRSMAVGSYNVAVQQAPSDKGLRGFLSSFNDFTNTAINAAAVGNKEEEEKAKVEVAKLTDEQRKVVLSKGARKAMEAGDIPSFAFPKYAEFAEQSAGELAARSQLASKLNVISDDIVSGKDPQAFDKAQQELFKTIPSYYAQRGAAGLINQYRQQVDGMVVEKQGQKYKNDVVAGLNADFTAVNNGIEQRLSNGANPSEVFSEATNSFVAAYKRAYDAGVGRDQIWQSIASTIGSIDDTTWRDMAIMNFKEAKLDSGLTLGTVFSEANWDSLERQSEQESKISQMVDGQQRLSSEELRSITALEAISDAASTPDGLTKIEAVGDSSVIDKVNSYKSLPDIDNEGIYNDNVKAVEGLIQSQNNTGAVSLLNAYLSSGQITKSEYSRLVKYASDTYSLRGIISPRVEEVAQGLRALQGVKTDNVELEDMKRVYYRNITNGIAEYRAKKPNATLDEIKANLASEAGIIQTALDKTGIEVTKRSDQISAEKARIAKEQESAALLAAKKVDTNIPWMSGKVDGLNKAIERRSQYTSKYIQTPVAIQPDEKYGFQKLYKWESQQAKDVMRDAVNVLNGISPMSNIAGVPTPKGTQSSMAAKEEALVAYNTAKNSIGYTYNEIASGMTPDGVKLSTEDKPMSINLSNVNTMYTLVVKDEAELNNIVNDRKKLELYKKTFGILNVPNFVERQKKLLQLAGKQ